MITHKGTIPLETERLLLRGLRVEDAQKVFDHYAGDDDVTRYLRWNTHKDVKETGLYLQGCEDNQADLSFYDWGMILKDSNEPIGSIGAFISTQEPDRYEVGYCLGKPFWRQAIAKEALRRVMQYLSEEVHIKRFICRHAKDNPASGAVMRHVGFEYVRDGVYKSFDGQREYVSSIYHLDID